MIALEIDYKYMGSDFPEGNHFVAYYGIDCELAWNIRRTDLSWTSTNWRKYFLTFLFSRSLFLCCLENR